jgi:hypothetical protein
MLNVGLINDENLPALTTGTHLPCNCWAAVQVKIIGHPLDAEWRYLGLQNIFGVAQNCQGT